MLSFAFGAARPSDSPGARQRPLLLDWEYLSADGWLPLKLAQDGTARFTRDGTITLHGDTAYTGNFYYDSFKDYKRAPLPTVATGKFTDGEGGYWVANANLTYATDTYSVSTWVKNLTDEEYYPFGISIENLFGNGYRVIAPPRTYGVEFRYNF